jgi:hypothetical protein
MLERDDTPWYPSVALFRQETYGNWKDTLEKIARTLLTTKVS